MYEVIVVQQLTVNAERLNLLYFLAPVTRRLNVQHSTHNVCKIGRCLGNRRPAKKIINTVSSSDQRLGRVGRVARARGGAHPRVGRARVHDRRVAHWPRFVPFYCSSKLLLIL